MKKSILNNRISEIISALLIILFVYAATSKLLDYQKFRVQVGQSPLLTDFASLVAWMIPVIEIVISLLLAFSRTRLLALYTSFSLMLMFTAYIMTIIKFSDNIPCSCGGVLQNMSWNQHLVFNLGFVVLTLVAIVVHPRYTLDKPGTSKQIKNAFKKPFPTA